MNKKEAIKIIEQDKIQLGKFVEINREVNMIQRKVKLVDYVPLETVISTIDKISETQKVTVPKFVAEKIEYCKNTSDHGLWYAMDYCYQVKHKDSADWLECNEDTFARAWLDGYTVEKEKLYTVEIPNPNSKGNHKIYLCKDDTTGKVYLCKGNFNPSKNRNLRLTEAEIRKDFEWAWQFAKPVEEK